MLKHWFCWKYQYNKYIFNFIDIYSFIPVSGYVAMGLSALLCPGVYNVVKTALYSLYWKGKFLQIPVLILLERKAPPCPHFTR
jgi:hypothetical protein